MTFDAPALRARLKDGLTRSDVAASDLQLNHLMDYLALLDQWNQVYNLTSVRDPRDMLSVHLLDALSILPLVDRHAHGAVLDVGSGAGLPAIPLAIMRDLDVWSVDAVAKKVSFQRQVKGSLHLSRFHPVHARVESMNLEKPVSIVVSRAFSDLPAMLVAVERHADADTTVIAMKGLVPTKEIAAIPPTWAVQEVVALDVPFLGAERCAVVIRRTSAAVH